MQEYEVHLISFRNKAHPDGYSVVHAKGQNVQSYHITALKKFLQQLEEQENLREFI